MRLTGASEIAPDSNDPRTHRIGFGELREIAKAWRELRKGDVKTAMRRIERTLDEIDPRWPSL